MIKKYQKFAYLGFFLAVFLGCLLAIGFFNLSINKIFAAVPALEVNYPTISGQTITAETGLPDYVLYLFNAGTFLGFCAVFVSLIIAGIMYFLSPVNAEMQANAKDRVSGAISGLLILVLAYLVITTINPKLSFLSFIAPTGEQPPPPAIETAPGIYFYKDSNCEDKICSKTNSKFCSNESECPSGETCINRDPPSNISNILDLGPFKNKLNAAKIVQDAENGTSYMSILYDAINLAGKCLYIDPTVTGCQPLNNFMAEAASASIYEYDPNPENNNPQGTGGVYFFRKSCLNINGQDNTNVDALINYCIENGGGWYQVTNEQIKNGTQSQTGGKILFVLDLNSTNFKEVPQKEQDCIKYTPNGECDDPKDEDENGGSEPEPEPSRQPPSLGGENISSVIINGNYVVIFIYQGIDGTAAGPWTYCQEFPTKNDTNKIGSRQIKYEKIRNRSAIANYVIFMPVKNNTITPTPEPTPPPTK